MRENMWVLSKIESLHLIYFPNPSIFLPRDLVIPLLGKYSKTPYPTTGILCTSMFPAILFMVARKQDQTIHPSTKEWLIKNVTHIQSGILFSCIEK